MPQHTVCRYIISHTRGDFPPPRDREGNARRRADNRPSGYQGEGERKGGGGAATTRLMAMGISRNRTHRLES